MQETPASSRVLPEQGRPACPCLMAKSGRDAHGSGDAPARQDLGDNAASHGCAAFSAMVRT
jgi:hypothetical protein